MNRHAVVCKLAFPNRQDPHDGDGGAGEGSAPSPSSPAPPTVEINTSDEEMDAVMAAEIVPPVEDEPGAGVTGIFDDPIEPCDEEPSSLVEAAAESMELAEAAESAAGDVGAPSTDGTGSKQPVALSRGKSHVFSGPVDASAVAQYEESDEARIAQDKRLPLFPADGPSPSSMAFLKAKLKELRQAHNALKSQRCAKDSVKTANGEVIHVEDSLPYGNDNAETLDMPNAALENLMDKFNAVEADLELETAAEAPSAAGPIWLWLMFFLEACGFHLSKVQLMCTTKLSNPSSSCPLC